MVRLALGLGAWLTIIAAGFPPATALVILAIAVLTYHAVACWLWPWAKCPHCKGTGRRPAPFSSHWGDCRWCDGRGRRVRLGRRAWGSIVGSDQA